MKIQHWAIVFIIIVVPLSIICRNLISKKNLNLRDETRYNNAVDNATFDAVSQILEVSEELGYGKNVPITEGVALAAIERFFNSLSVNFNMPHNIQNAEAYFGQYVPAIIIVGYDGIYVYSCEKTTNGYEFKLKPKIPYAYTYETPSGDEIYMNFTLDNYVTLYFPNDHDKFMVGIPNEEGNTDGTHMLSGYVGQPLDIDQNGIDDLNDMLVTIDGIEVLVEYNPASGDLYEENDDPFTFIDPDTGLERDDLTEYIKSQVPTFTDNLSYILESLKNSSISEATAKRVNNLKFLYDDSTVSPNQDYEYNEDREIITEASEFHKLRRDTIINLITAVMREEFNEHNSYAKSLGITYNFNVPNIARDQWNNTIDDISVLAFFQGMPMGVDTYYNNYSLGGARIVKANYLYGETVTDGEGVKHKVYHKYYCPLIPRDDNGNPRYADGSVFENGTIPSGDAAGDVPRITTGIEQIFINEDDAREGYIDPITNENIRYYICSECM